MNNNSHMFLYKLPRIVIRTGRKIQMSGTLYSGSFSKKINFIVDIFQRSAIIKPVQRGIYQSVDASFFALRAKKYLVDRY